MALLCAVELKLKVRCIGWCYSWPKADFCNKNCHQSFRVSCYAGENIVVFIEEDLRRMDFVTGRRLWRVHQHRQESARSHVKEGPFEGT